MKGKCRLNYVRKQTWKDKLFENLTKEVHTKVHFCTCAWSKNFRDPGVILNRSLSMEPYIKSLCCQCFLYLRNISKIRKFLTNDTTKILVHAMVISRLDYANSLLRGISDKLMNKLQKVQNYAARLIMGTSLREHITPVLHSLHWLPVKYRIMFKVLLFTYQAINS